MSYTDRDLIELACCAPAVPEWFEPDMTGVENPLRSFTPGSRLYAVEWNSEFARRRLAQWPKAYARMVLEAK